MIRGEFAPAIRQLLPHLPESFVCAGLFRSSGHSRNMQDAARTSLECSFLTFTALPQKVMDHIGLQPDVKRSYPNRKCSNKQPRSGYMFIASDLAPISLLSGVRCDSRSRRHIELLTEFLRLTIAYYRHVTPNGVA